MPKTLKDGWPVDAYWCFTVWNVTKLTQTYNSIQYWLRDPQTGATASTHTTEPDFVTSSASIGLTLCPTRSCPAGQAASPHSPPSKRWLRLLGHVARMVFNVTAKRALTAASKLPPEGWCGPLGPTSGGALPAADLIVTTQDRIIYRTLVATITDWWWSSS